MELWEHKKHMKDPGYIALFAEMDRRVNGIVDVLEIEDGKPVYWRMIDDPDCPNEHPRKPVEWRRPRP